MSLKDKLKLPQEIEDANSAPDAKRIRSTEEADDRMSPTPIKLGPRTPMEYNFCCCFRCSLHERDNVGAHYFDGPEDDALYV